MQKIKLGCQATDKITGFTGTVTGLVSYLTGCDQALITPKSTDGKYPDGNWLDVNRLEIGDAEPIQIETSNDKGACEAPPVK